MRASRKLDEPLAPLIEVAPATEVAAEALIHPLLPSEFQQEGQLPISGATWRVAGASTVGSDHADRAIACQDAFHSNYPELCDPRRKTRGELFFPLVLSVADGAGSSRHSAAGAALCVSLATEISRERLREFDWTTATDAALATAGKGILTATKRAVRAGIAAALRGRAPEVKIEDFRSTLLLAIVNPPWLLTVQVGDGFVVLELGPERHQLLAAPERESTEVNVTSFVTTELKQMRYRIEAQCIPDLTGIALSTDGLEGLALDYEAGVVAGPHEALFTPLFQGVGNASWDSGRLLRLLRSPRVADEAHDDVTLLVGACTRSVI